MEEPQEQELRRSCGSGEGAAVKAEEIMTTTEKLVMTVFRTRGLKDPKLRNCKRPQSRAKDSGPLGLEAPTE